ncbi:hypothetical protein PMAYCL1PPCAC_11228, partial [Pristionchus mayeri]
GCLGSGCGGWRKERSTQSSFGLVEPSFLFFENDLLNRGDLSHVFCHSSVLVCKDDTVTSREITVLSRRL